MNAGLGIVLGGVVGAVAMDRFNYHMATTHNVTKFGGIFSNGPIAHPAPLGAGIPFIPPSSYNVTSAYGMRKHPVTGIETQHWGIDFGAPAGSPVWATADGIVTSSFYEQNAGNLIYIYHPDTGYTSAYFHLQEALVVPDQEVRQGETIALSGSTGALTTGPHLHFELKDTDGYKVDPAPLIFADPSQPQTANSGFVDHVNKTEWIAWAGLLAVAGITTWALWPRDKQAQFKTA